MGCRPTAVMFRDPVRFLTPLGEVHATGPAAVCGSLESADGGEGKRFVQVWWARVVATSCQAAWMAQSSAKDGHENSYATLYGRRSYSPAPEAHLKRIVLA